MEGGIAHTMILEARVAYPSLMMNGTDWFQKLSPYFLNLSYTDSCDGEKADDMQLQLADRDRRFINDWMPDKGAYIDVGIIAERWYSPNATTLKLDCGRLWIDEIEFELPQHTVTIKGNSIPTTATIKANTETRNWEASTLRDLVKQIVEDENKMKLTWLPDSNPSYTAVEQTEQSALEFLMHRARDAKLAIKIHRGEVVVFDELKLEEAEPKFAIVYGNAAPAAGLHSFRIATGNFITRLIDTNAKATMSQVDPASGKMTQGVHVAGDEQPASDWHQAINQGTDSQDEEGDEGGDDGGGETREDPVSSWQQTAASADLLAKSHNRHHNKDRVEAKIQFGIGNPIIAAGQTFMLSGVGKYDGKWFVKTAEHKVGPMFTTTIDARKCLEGY